MNQESIKLFTCLIKKYQFTYLENNYLYYLLVRLINNLLQYQASFLIIIKTES